jgi:hypothetical protein
MISKKRIEKSLSAQLLSRLRFEPRTFQIMKWSAIHLAMIIGLFSFCSSLSSHKFLASRALKVSPVLQTSPT